MPPYLTFMMAEVKIKLPSHFFPISHGCYITSLRMLILWIKMYQEFRCYSDLKDVAMLRRKRRVFIVSTATPELEFYSGRRSFLAIKIHVGSSDLGLFLLFNKSIIWISNKSTFSSPETLKYWVGVQQGHSYLMGRRCLFSLGWPPF